MGRFILLNTFLVLLCVYLPFVRSSVSTCNQIAEAISSASDVYWPLSFHYAKDIGHWMTSSSNRPACSVEPGIAEDVGVILQILNQTRTPFAIKGGGHASNPGFSSTTGVQIAMYRFSEVEVDVPAGTVDIGAGLIWDDVYAALEPHGVNVVGGRVTGVGVAGFTLGGGYSYKTNQYGLTVDTVVAYELVMPNGTIVDVTETSDPGLFFALKGGYNNYGIVTKFTLKTFPQTDVWGGLITITEDHIDAVNAATAKFSANVTDPKASIITTYNYLFGQPGVSQILFYDGPTPPDGIFDDFLSIPYFTKDISTRSYTSLVQASPANVTAGQRGIFNTVSLLNYSEDIINAILNETKFWGERLSLESATFISYDVEPFMTSLFTHGADTAYPPSRSRGLLPLNIYYAWIFPEEDAQMQEAARQSASHVTDVAVADGQYVADAALYGNYAIFDTPLERIFGDNLDKLRTVKARIDPDDVMSLVGGWKLIG